MHPHMSCISCLTSHTLAMHVCWLVSHVCWLVSHVFHFKAHSYKWHSLCLYDAHMFSICCTYLAHMLCAYECHTHIHKWLLVVCANKSCRFVSSASIMHSYLCSVAPYHLFPSRHVTTYCFRLVMGRAPCTLLLVRAPFIFNSHKACFIK